VIITRSSADADNGLDAFSSQPRSTNMVFWVHCDFLLSMWSAPTDSLRHFHSSSVLTAVAAMQQASTFYAVT